jgi:hypothetical protein
MPYPSSCHSSFVNYLKIEGYEAVKKGLEQTFNLVLTKAQLKNPWHRMKKKWKIWKQLFQHETGWQGSCNGKN